MIIYLRNNLKLEPNIKKLHNKKIYTFINIIYFLMPIKNMKKKTVYQILYGKMSIFLRCFIMEPTCPKCCNTFGN